MVVLNVFAMVVWLWRVCVCKGVSYGDSGICLRW